MMHRVYMPLQYCGQKRQHRVHRLQPKKHVYCLDSSQQLWTPDLTLLMRHQLLDSVWRNDICNVLFTFEEGCSAEATECSIEFEVTTGKP
uniref:Uncharacterized protein n=1 Tax=Pygocentrus nattereri TaxID=42514 RepID=A0A3B4E2U1_PYGNA